MSKADKTQLIQTAVCSIVYGQFGGEYQELFRCQRELDDVDLRGYVNDNRCVLGFENDDTKTAALMAESVLAISACISRMAGMEDGLLIKGVMCQKRTSVVLQTSSTNLPKVSREAAAGR